MQSVNMNHFTKQKKQNSATVEVASATTKLDRTSLALSNRCDVVRCRVKRRCIILLTAGVTSIYAYLQKFL